MAELIFDNVTLHYPIYNARNMSLRNQLVRVATGGLIEREAGKPLTVTALRDVSFALHDGATVGLIGHNGSGKSTLLRTMAGIYRPDVGSIRRVGRVATVFDIGAGMEPDLSGYENIIQLALMAGLSLSEAGALVADVEEFTELGDFLKLAVRTYSSGMTLRLMFAVATAVTPEILLIDEMFATGDESFQVKSRARLEKLVSAAKIFVFASHDHDMLRSYCKRIFRLDHGTFEEVS